MPSYEVLTPNGVFEVLQRFTYGEMTIAILLTILVVITGLKFIWEVAVREGWL